MNKVFQQTWNTYGASWKAASTAEKRALFEKSLDKNCRYNDPLVSANGWEELEAVMLDFHHQVPGGYFVTRYFQAHNNKSIAKWEMLNGENIVIGDGISYGEYNEHGKLVSMTGFFELPK